MVHLAPEEFPPKVDLYKTPKEKMRQSGAESRGSQLAEEQSVSCLFLTGAHTHYTTMGERQEEFSLMSSHTNFDSCPSHFHT